jgi:hypothetical protein
MMGSTTEPFKGSRLQTLMAKPDCTSANTTSLEQTVWSKFPVRGIMSNPVRCERCGETKDCQSLAQMFLCQLCLILILREWRIRKEDFAELAQ